MNKQARKVSHIKTESKGASKLKVMVITLLIAMQLAVIVFFNTRYALIAQGFSTFSAVISFLTCLYVLSTNKNGLSKAVWIIFLLTCFTFGYIIFWVSGERIFLKSAKKRYKAVYQQKEEYLLNSIEEKNCCQTSKKISNFTYSSGKFLTCTGCRQEYFNDGESFFNQIKKCIESAKHFIFIEFYIIAEGKLFDEIFMLLFQKVKSGVEVRVIYDDLGCKNRFSNKIKKRLIDAGIKLMPFNRILPVVSFSFNYRDHRKIVVIDGLTAFTGGCNLADEYVNEISPYGYWKDCGIKIQGSSVDTFTLLFLRQWEVISKEREDYSQYLNKYKSYDNGSIVIPFADGLEYEHNIARGVYETLIASSNEFLYIATPYFVVDDGITNLLINKALSGVDVRIILPGVPDKKFVYLVSRNNAEKLCEYGVKVYLAKDTFVHSKCVLTEEGVVLGSINMDLRSFYQQFECAVYTDDKKITKVVLDDFNFTMNKSVLINQNNKLRKNLFYRVFAGIMQVFAPFM